MLFIVYSETGENLLVSYCSDYVYLFSLNHQNTKSCDESGSYASSAIKDDCQSVPLSRLPPIKRLRLRGDWSDTGPSSRPEDEEQVQSRDPSMNFLFLCALLIRIFYLIKKKPLFCVCLAIFHFKAVL